MGQRPAPAAGAGAETVGVVCAMGAAVGGAVDVGAAASAAAGAPTCGTLMMTRMTPGTSLWLEAARLPGGLAGPPPSPRPLELPWTRRARPPLLPLPPPPPRLPPLLLLLPLLLPLLHRLRPQRVARGVGALSLRAA